MHGSVAVSIALHIAIVGAFLQALGTQRSLDWLQPLRSDSGPVDERVVFASLPAAASPEQRRFEPRVAEPAAATIAANATSASDPSRAIGAIATRATDSTTVRTPATTEGGPSDRAYRGTLRDSTDGVSLRPRRTDSRLWAAPATTSPPAPANSRLPEQDLARAIRASNDSISALGVQTVHPDWLITRDGRKYGVDNNTIYLGAISLPAVVLGLLPIPHYGCMPTLYLPERAVRDSAGTICITLDNPNVAERRERIGEMSAEIRARAELSMRGREEIARIDARKARERAATRSAIAKPPR